MNDKKYTYGKRQKIESVKSMDFLKGVNPAYAQHIFHQNRIVEAFAMSELGGVNVLEQPICGKCEKPGWNVDNPNFVSTGDIDKDVEIKNCYCVACGTTTYNTRTLREHLIKELNIQEDKIANLENQLENTKHGGVSV